MGREKENLVDIASEFFRFEGVLEKVLTKLTFEDRSKYASQFSWFDKRIKTALGNAGLNIVTVEGLTYDPGMAITPINLDDFGPSDELIVIKMLEPIIMEEGSVVRAGTALLGRKDL